MRRVAQSLQGNVMRWLVIVWALAATPAFADPAIVPDPVLTPGQARDLTLEQICSTKWGHDERAVTQAMKNQVFDEYHIAAADRHLPDGKPAFEVDHLVSRELGGADAVANLWPEPYTGPWNAHMKDRVENRLHVEVCAGRLPLGEAQHDISTDWRAAFVRYFGEPK